MRIVKMKDRKASHKLKEDLGLVSIRNCIQRGRPRWFGHVEIMEKDSLVKKCREMVVEGHRGEEWTKTVW